jgi:hypothetical protein
MSSTGELIKTDLPGFYRDPRTGAVINTQGDEYLRIKAERAKAREIDAMKERLNSLSGDVNEIKAMLQILIGRGG